MAATPVVDTGILDHVPELVGIALAILAPFTAAIAYFIKRMIGRVEKDIDKCCEANESLDDRVTDIEKVMVKVGTYHRMNHPGQEID